jgi:hypothetical protein
MFFFDAVDLAMTAVTGDHQHTGTGSPDLVRFSPAIKYPFLVISSYQGAPAPATTDLVHVRRIEIGPVIHALAEDPTWLLKKSMPKTLLGSSPIIARIMIGCRSLETRCV